MAKKDFFTSRNPVLKEKVFQQQGSGLSASVDYTPMTIAGAINKTMILFAILVLVSAISYTMPSSFLLWTGMICALITAIIAIYKPHTSAIAAPVYAGFKGMFVGSLTAFYGMMYEGIVLQAVVLTFSSLVIMLLIYKYEIIKVTDKLRTGIVMATGSIMILYVISLVSNIVFGFKMPFIHEGGWFSIGFSVVVIGVAAMNLLLDFDLFEKGAEEKSPQYMEWFCGLSLMITLVWLYVEFLRLLSYIND